MEKIKIAQNAFIYPMPMTVVGTVVEGRINYLAVAWVSRVNVDPPMIGVALGKKRHTSKGIREYQEFSVNVPVSTLSGPSIMSVSFQAIRRTSPASSTLSSGS